MSRTRSRGGDEVGSEARAREQEGKMIRGRDMMRAAMSLSRRERRKKN